MIQQLSKGLLLLIPSLCFGFVNDSIQIESDHAQYHFQEGVMVHQKNVVVHWQDRTLHADELKLFKAKEGELNKMIALGKPAVMNGKLADGTQMIGKANEMEYNPLTKTLVLKGQAELNQGVNVFTGPKITLNLETNNIFADKDGENRPKMVFEMKDNPA